MQQSNINLNSKMPLVIAVSPYKQLTKAVLNIFLTFVMISSIPIFGQNHFLGIKGGVNSTNANSKSKLIDNGYLKGFNVGLSYEFIIGSNFTLGADFLYFQKGFTNDLIFTDENGNQVGEKAIINFNYDYLTLPIKGGFIVGKKISGFVNLGLVPSFLIKAIIDLPVTEDINALSLDVTDNVTKFDLGGIIEIGGNYKFKERYILFTSFSYQHSFTTTTNSVIYLGSNVKHYGLALSVGLKYALKKE